MQLSPDDPRLTWRGHVELERSGDGWWRPWRLPSREVAAVAAGHLATRARDAAGVRLDLVAPGGEMRLLVRGHPEAPLDVLVDGAMRARVGIDGEREVRLSAPSGSRVQLWLPQFGHVELGPLTLERPPGSPPAEPRWVTYGSSITQCRGAAGPSETWPALVSRSLGWDATALGFGGEAHLDPVAARTIAARPADVLSMCIGVNIHAHATFAERTLAPAILDFVERARAGREVPTLLIGPITSPEAEEHVNAVGLTLARVRELVRMAAQRSGASYLDGRELLGDADAALLVDGVHPGPEGYRLIAERLIPVLAASA